MSMLSNRSRYDRVSCMMSRRISWLRFKNIFGNSYNLDSIIARDLIVQRCKLLKITMLAEAYEVSLPSL